MSFFYTLRIYRGNPSQQHWEDFFLDLVEGENVISALMRLRKKPVNAKGEAVLPVVWEDGCLEEVCGSCSMLIDGHPRQACTALIANLLKGKKQPVITLAPLSKFPLVRDLIVDRSQMFDNLKKMQAWIAVDDYQDPHTVEPMNPRTEQLRYVLSKCITCGCCSEACPQIGPRSSFIGPAAIAQAWLFDLHPVGALQADERRRQLMGKDGVASCGSAQNCVRVCPKHLPLTEAIGAMAKEVGEQAIKDWLSPQTD
jgi:succinate dehydrogenase / fumarate reductase iron-sulfur subunit